MTTMKPLIVYCVSGGAYLDMLELSLASLFRFGRYDGAVLVETETSEKEIRKRVPSLTLFRSRIARADYGGSGQKAIMSRFNLHRHRLVSKHAPVLFFDADIIFDAPVSDLLEQIHGCGRIAFPLELWVRRADAIFMGAEFIRFAGLDGEGAGLNAGTFGVPDGGALGYRQALEEITRTTDVLQACFPLRVGHTPEQSVITFLETRDRMYDVDILTRFVKFTAGGPYDLDPAPRGCVHFLMGSETKLQRMRQYSDDLARDDQGASPSSKQPSVRVFTMRRFTNARRHAR